MKVNGSEPRIVPVCTATSSGIPCTRCSGGGQVVGPTSNPPMGATEAVSGASAGRCGIAVHPDSRGGDDLSIVESEALKPGEGR